MAGAEEELADDEPEEPEELLEELDELSFGAALVEELEEDRESVR
ncbi:hypothetical protein [Georgenia sp. SUBG003]